ncbi:hypothetical protein V3W47_19030 [Deinococcus sp. YIM 134068]|uniref:hypothetical protein n=1 Tax=Deinococcus lichenicola TaxID=3118910 RepID=UPI002F9452DE
MGKRRTSSDSLPLLGFGVVGLLALGGVVAYRRQQGTPSIASSGNKTTTTTTTAPTSTTVGSSIQFGVDASRYYPVASSSFGSFSSYYGGSTGLEVLAGSGTDTPTSSSDASPTQTAKYGVNYVEQFNQFMQQNPGTP